MTLVSRVKPKRHNHHHGARETPACRAEGLIALERVGVSSYLISHDSGESVLAYPPLWPFMQSNLLTCGVGVRQIMSAKLQGLG